jgi:hypothetical protein
LSSKEVEERRHKRAKEDERIKAIIDQEDLEERLQRIAIFPNSSLFLSHLTIQEKIPP